ncbi:MAG: hypothetical protein GY722_21760, partial [bacterium]|nr:hypothetical protein [bacterium]
EQQIKERAEAAERRKEAERLEAEALKAAEADDNVGFESDAQRAEDLRVEAAAAEKLAERKSTPAQAGTARSTVSYRYEPEVVDDTKIPRIYLKPDMVMIRSMRSQKPAPPEIPGIRWKKIPNVSVR